MAGAASAAVMAPVATSFCRSASREFALISSGLVRRTALRRCAFSFERTPDTQVRELVTPGSALRRLNRPLSSIPAE